MNIDYTQRPAIKPFDEFSIDSPAPVTLPNGTTLYVVNGGDQEVVKLDVIHRGGLFEESPQRLVSQAMASMLSQGTRQMSSQDIAEILDYNGAWISSRSTHNHTSLSLSSLNRCFEKTLQIVRDMVYSPTFPERELQIYRNRCLSAYRTARKRVKYLAGVEMNRIFFGEQYPLSSAIGDDDINALQADMLRDFHKRYYHANNRTIILSGCVTDREIDMVIDAFGKEPDPCPITPYTDPLQHSTDTHFSIVEKDDAVQSAVQMQIAAIPRTHPDYFKLRILVTALGGYFGSRLMANVREDKGYTYGIGAALIGYRTGAYMSISTECDCSYTMPLIAEVRQEIDRLRQEPLPQKELEIVKSTMLSDLVKNLDTPFAIAANVSAIVLYDIYPEYFNEQIKAIRSATSAELLDVAQRYLLDDRLYTAIAGKKE